MTFGHRALARFWTVGVKASVACSMPASVYRKRKFSTLSLRSAVENGSISTFEHSLVLSKNRTIASTNWENQHYFETFSAPTLKIRTSLNPCSEF